MAQTIYILSQRYGSDMSDPVVFLDENEANKTADDIMKEVIQDSYANHTGDDTQLSLKELEQWADNNGYGDARYFWDGSDDATEIKVTKHEI